MSCSISRISSSFCDKKFPFKRVHELVYITSCFTQVVVFLLKFFHNIVLVFGEIFVYEYFVFGRTIRLPEFQ